MSETTSAPDKNTRYYIWTAISLFFIFGFGRIVPEFAGITPAGIHILGIFFGVLIATITTGETLWPGLMGMFAMIICDFTTPRDMLQTWFGNTTIQQIIWVMALTGAVTESGAMDVLARKTLKIKALKGHPMRLIVALFLAVFVCSALVSSPTTMILLWYPILDVICEICGIEKNCDLKRELLLGIYISIMGAYILPFKGIHLSSIAIISGIMEANGLPFDNGIYLLTSAFIVLALVVVYIVFIRYVWKADLAPLRNFDVQKMNLTEVNLRMTGRQKILFGTLIFGILFLLTGMVLPKGSAALGFYNKIGSTWIWIFLFAALCIIREPDGTPFINGTKLLQNKTMWGVVVIAGCLTTCGTAIASDDYGIKDAISRILSPVLGNASWPLMVILCVAIATLFTNFTNGLPVSFTANAICIPIACTLQMRGSGNATVLGTAIIMSSMCAFLTNGATAYAPLMLGREEMTTRFIFTKGVIVNAAYIVLASLICIVMGLLL